MTTTLASFYLINSNLQRTLTTTANKPMVARETEYYLANIGNVKSIDDFLANDRVFKYAMKAWGLEEMDYAKAFMRKVLESDLNDKSSFANKLTDKRYLEFAKAFNFLPTGDVELGTLRAQDSGSEDAMIGLYTQQRISKGETAAAEAKYFSDNIGSITSVDDLLANERLFNFALTSQGLDAKLASVSAIRNVLTSDLNDPGSVANTYGEKYQKLAAAFSFAADGSVTPGNTAQSEQQTKQMMLAYYEATDADQSPAAAVFKTAYFNQAMASVTNVDDLANNSFLRDFVATAAGLNPLYTTAATIRDILVSDLDDPDSIANQSALHKAVAATFNFNTDGSLDSGVVAQDTAQAKALSDLFTKYHDGDSISAEQTSTDYYRSAMKSVQHVDTLLSDSKLYNFILSAFDIDPDEVSKTKIKRILLSDPSSVTSYANLLQDSRFKDLAAAFNFDSDGFALGARQVQTADGAKNAIALYKATLGDSASAQTLGNAEAQYYDRTILTLSSVDQLLKNERLKSFIVKAYGLKDATNDTLRKIFTSDLLDERSFVNKSGNEAYKALAADFKFDTDGSVRRAELGVAQSKPDIMRTRALYYRQAVEEDAGNENEGVRLALYFDRKAATITSPYSILADKALLQVVQTALRLPTQMSLLDIDRQAEMITKALDVKDFSDPSKVKAFLTRFTAAWEMDNSTASQSSASILIGQPLEASISTSLLTNIQNLRLGGA
ncbi:DUF1217 domain-containing protein [Hyphomicrobium sp. D-2]|uniref:DUF1217 domain-containing protein n=1 Tax=Hyphomicrobium sp. D-2 TaxID=3041621 RepID=UPI002454EA5A|nr:DUF1217 domain-containing protein [Hyphomicrobium sp. D-2]MDH4983636.1 DUF1217 domain-containing protein [Hyphomicrobium sp. D-2]